MSDRTNKILCLRGLVCPLIYFVALVLAGCGGDPVGPIPVPDTDYKGLDRPAQPYGALVERVAAFLMSDKGSGGFGEGG